MLLYGSVNLAFTGGFLIAAAVTGLRMSWRRRSHFGRAIVFLCWLTIASAFYAFNLNWGSEFGISYALFGTSLSGFILVLANVEIRKAKMDKGRTSTLLRRSRLEKGTASTREKGGCSIRLRTGEVADTQLEYLLI